LSKDKKGMSSTTTKFAWQADQPHRKGRSKTPGESKGKSSKLNH
jgi:hypothetical protein